MLGRDSQKRPGGEPNARLAEAAAPAEGEGSQLEAAFGVEGHRPTLAPAAVPGNQ
jgi:hypothetical protein